ncbi:hypothetical protein CHLRE_07g352550v5 [Chlamydomonas reinhardtii]|uniref:Arsenate reductase n=1 Tax=Chlamydomonas reinhardtii TaxID=3055 RepID=A8IUB5_CHLRE|nr:uncharacterized protein CHLRE_07g352550v5 [Chlamydomonas reinhardtii]ADP09375.1 arsenate reductase [Chlamydomonas reinhardtii]PNW81357.1 hypothetical protein CHLRE_07g352550v5 [Chlamydomonas reinhardtii]|eukprot:XP_001692614.1 rhodanese domain phosphatase [Chlamydomonas reinhardtii]
MGHDSDELVAPELSRVDPSFVADVVKSGDKKTLIVDVRDAHEVAEGSIKSALNVPSSVFKSEDKSQLDAVIKEQLAGAEQVVVHCHFSKVRGPTCARALNERLKALGLDNAPEVKVLAGGVAGFMDSYKGDSEVAVLPAQGWDPAQK